jgi:hypothetical protein
MARRPRASRRAAGPIASKMADITTKLATQRCTGGGLLGVLVTLLGCATVPPAVVSRANQIAYFVAAHEGGEVMDVEACATGPVVLRPWSTPWERIEVLAGARVGDTLRGDAGGCVRYRATLVANRQVLAGPEAPAQRAVRVAATARGAGGAGRAALRAPPGAAGGHRVAGAPGGRRGSRDPRGSGRARHARRQLPAAAAGAGAAERRAAGALRGSTRARWAARCCGWRAWQGRWLMARPS